MTPSWQENIIAHFNIYEIQVFFHDTYWNLSADIYLYVIWNFVLDPYEVWVQIHVYEIWNFLCQMWEMLYIFMYLYINDTCIHVINACIFPYRENIKFLNVVLNICVLIVIFMKYVILYMLNMCIWVQISIYRICEDFFLLYRRIWMEITYFSRYKI